MRQRLGGLLCYHVIGYYPLMVRLTEGLHVQLNLGCLVAKKGHSTHYNQEQNKRST